MERTQQRDPRACDRPTRRPVVAFGPEMPDWGSWQWVGEDTMRVLSQRFAAVRFGWDEVPRCDVLAIVKHVPPPGFMERLPGRTAVVYCPVDFFESEQHIAACAALLQRCQRIVVHCERLRRHFEPYAPVETMDHPVKFVTKRPVAYRSTGYVLWVGVWPNLESLAAWVNEHPLPCRLRVLTNLEEGKTGVPAEFGFRADRDVVIEQWDPKRQLELTRGAKAAIDVKGSDFRQRHKPPAKGLDSIASGLPLAMNLDSSTAEHLARLGFELADPLDTGRWFSREYWKETQRFGSALRELLSPRRIGRRFERLFEQVLDQRPGASILAITPGVDRPMAQPSENVAPSQQDAAADGAVSGEQAKYHSACRLAEGGNRVESRRLYEKLQADASDGHLKALIQNDLAVLAAADGDVETARAGFEAALEMDSACEPARRNLAVLTPTALAAETGSGEEAPSVPPTARSSESDEPIKVAILSFLFNWPSTGGGIVHTVELAQFLARAGYQVQHVYARYEPWGIGKVEHRPPFPSRELVFDESQWNLAEIQRCYRDAEAVFVVNPPTADMVAPYAGRVAVSPAGMAPARFPWPWKEEPVELRTPGRLMVFFAGLVNEPIKGFHVLHEACRRLGQRRRDFELVATGDPPGRVDDFTRFVGWQSQRDLPRHLRAADVCVVPAVAQEALGRTAVEAMAAGRPVVASRLGGLPWTIEDGVTGLLCEGGDPEDLLRKIEILLTKPELRQRKGGRG